MEKMLPVSLEAEVGVLGCLILVPEDIALVADVLLPEHFYREAHQILYRAMIHLFERQEPNDMFSLQDLLERQGKLEKAGGEAYIGKLIAHTYTSTKMETFANAVVRTAMLRKLIAAGGEIVSMAFDAGEASATDIMDKAESLIYDVSRQDRIAEVSSMTDLINSFMDDFDNEDQNSGSIVGVPSGIDCLDAFTGGWQRSDLIIVAGRPAMGKTSLALSLARNAGAMYDRGVLVFSLEMSKEQLTQRMVALEAQVDLHRLRMRQLETDEQVEVIQAASKLVNLPIYIDDTPAITLSALRSKIRREMSKHDIDLVLVDYLQLIRATIDGKRIKDRYLEVSEVARGLKDIAREFNIPVIALAQLSRAVESRQSKVPQLSDLKESGEIEQAADIVFFIYRDDYYAGHDEQGKSLSNRPKTADLVAAKHRNGSVGEVVVGFEASQTRFCNKEEIDIYKPEAL